jgi:hypothetical protein
MPDPVIHQAATDTLKVLLLQNKALTDSLKIFVMGNQDPWWQSALAQLLGVFVGGLISFIAVWYALRKQLANEAQKWTNQQAAETAKMDTQFKQQLDIIEKQHQAELHKIELAHQNEVKKINEQFSLELSKEFQFKRLDVCQELLKISKDSLIQSGRDAVAIPYIYTSFQLLTDFKIKFYDYALENSVVLGSTISGHVERLNNHLVDHLRVLNELSDINLQDQEVRKLGQASKADFFELSNSLRDSILDSLKIFNRQAQT